MFDLIPFSSSWPHMQAPHYIEIRLSPRSDSIRATKAMKQNNMKSFNVNKSFNDASMNDHETKRHKHGSGIARNGVVKSVPYCGAWLIAGQSSQNFYLLPELQQLP